MRAQESVPPGGGTLASSYAKKPPSKSFPRRLFGNRSFVMSFPGTPTSADRLWMSCTARWRVGNLQARSAFALRAGHRLRLDSNLAVAARLARSRSPDRVANCYRRRSGHRKHNMRWNRSPMPGSNSPHSKHTTHRIRKRRGCNGSSTSSAHAIVTNSFERPYNLNPARFGSPECVCFAETLRPRPLPDACWSGD